jgi:peptide/nickel transport system permease protein
MAVVLPATNPSPEAIARSVRLRSLWRDLPLKAKVGAVILGVYVLLAIFGPTLAPFDANATNPNATSATAPSIHHLFGTTNDGGDVFSQVLVGIRSTVVLGLLTACFATVLSVFVGVTAGYLAGAADEALMLVANVFLVLPALPLLIVVLGYLPHAGELPTAVVLSVLGWAWGARVIRAQTLALRRRDYVSAARETGERAWRIIACEIIPNEVSLIAASFIGTALYAILTSVALSFIGVANISNINSLGVIFYWAQSQGAVESGWWWWYVAPGVIVALLGMSLVLLNFGLDELGNPRLRDTSASRKSTPGKHRVRPTEPTPVMREAALS